MTMAHVTHVYPVRLTPEPEGGYCVIAPDLPGCVTSSETITEGVEKIKDGICGMLYMFDRDGRPRPIPSNPNDIKQENPSDIIALVDVDLDAYKRTQSDRAVRRTVSIPEWLDNDATEAGISLSKVLQEALKEHLHIQQ